MTLNTETSRTQPDNDLGAATMPSERSSFIADAVSAIKDRSQTAAQVAMLSAAVAGSLPSMAEASIIHPGNDPQHQIFGAGMVQNQQLLGGRADTAQFGDAYFSATPYFTGDRLYALMPTHSFQGLLPYNPDFSFSFDSNLNQWGSQQVYNSLGFEMHGDIDLAIFDLGPNSGAPTIIGSISAGETTLNGGFGRTAYIGGPDWSDRLARGWEMKATGSGLHWYTQNLLFSSSTGLQFNANAWQGDSGGAVYNSAGELTGFNLSQSGGMGPGGLTAILDLSHPDVYSRLPPSIPAPGTAAAFMVGLGLAGRRRRTE